MLKPNVPTKLTDKMGSKDIAVELRVVDSGEMIYSFFH